MWNKSGKYIPIVFLSGHQRFLKVIRTTVRHEIQTGLLGFSEDSPDRHQSMLCWASYPPHLCQTMLHRASHRASIFGDVLWIVLGQGGNIIYNSIFRCF